jgi:NAD(P)-dependent dehydrogenase (short-subunit alcohol dehydrogenase family)
MEWKDFELTERVAVVTGSSRGIGKAIALRFAKAGADLAICSRHMEELEEVAKEIRSYGRKCLPVEANVGQRQGIEAFFDEVFKTYPKINILVNNLGINPKLTFLIDMEESIWDRVMGTNLKGYLLASQIAGRNMRNHGGGVIINISSIGGIQPARAGGAYCVSKAGVNMLTKVMAQEMARYNIRVNAICPGLIKTDFSRALWDNPKTLNLRIENSAMRRIGEPEEVAGAALYLAADAASFVTGELFFVTGGRI